jgi:hypothetical protein
MPKKLTNAEQAANEITKYSHSACPMLRVPKKIKPGRVLYHNHVMHTVDMPNSLNGFRCWTQPASRPVLDGFAECPCGYAGLPHYAHKDHIKATKGKAKTTEHMIKVGAFSKDWGKR